MTPAWAQRREELLSDCIVSPEVLNPMVDRLGEFVVSYQLALETEVPPPHASLPSGVTIPFGLNIAKLRYIKAHLQRKNPEEIAALVDVDRQVMQDFIGIAPWDHRPLVTVLVRQVADQLGEPDGIIAFNPSRFPNGVSIR